jgi:hypothetical protein
MKAKVLIVLISSALLTGVLLVTPGCGKSTPTFTLKGAGQ